MRGGWSLVVVRVLVLWYGKVLVVGRRSFVVGRAWRVVVEARKNYLRQNVIGTENSNIRLI
jgi:hypothetical protein